MTQLLALKRRGLHAPNFITIVKDFGGFILPTFTLLCRICSSRYLKTAYNVYVYLARHQRNECCLGSLELGLFYTNLRPAEFSHRPPKVVSVNNCCIHKQRPTWYIERRKCCSYVSTMSSSEGNKPPLVPDSAKESEPQFDPTARTRNWFSILLGTMPPSHQILYREDQYARHEKRDCDRCEEWRDYNLKYSPIVIFMQKNIRDLNGKLDADNIRCRRCPTRITEDGKTVRQGGGFSPEHGIQLCANEMRDSKHVEDTLAHEMVHAWDHLRWKVDWGDLRHAACSEVCLPWPSTSTEKTAKR